MRFSLADVETEEEEEEEEEANGRKRKKSAGKSGIEENSKNSRIRRIKEDEELEEGRGAEEKIIVGGGGEDKQEEEKGAEQLDGDEDGRGLAVWIDPDALDCSVCFEPLRPPIYQCQNGHVMCFSCCTKVCNRCHLCSHFIGNIRCLALEKVIESIRVPCSHATFGCKKTLLYAQRDIHKESCIYAPCSCPIPDCTFHGSAKTLSVHFKSQHINSAKSFVYDQFFKLSVEQTMPTLVLCGEDDHLFLLLNNYDVNRGNALSVVCIQPSALGWGFMYELAASGKGSTLQLKASVTNIRQWNGVYPTEVFLLVPHDFCAPSQKIILDVCIQRTKTSVVQ